MRAATDLQPPPLPEWFVPRRRLIKALDAALDQRLTVVVGGPGFGKSTVLAAWGPPHGCVWYSAGPHDVSTADLARGLVLALRRRLPALRADLELLMRPGRMDDERAHAELLAGLICEAIEPLLIGRVPVILDAAEHLFPTSPAVRLLSALCRQAPGAVRFVLASRIAAPREIVRAAGGAVMIGTDELTFSTDETRAMLAGTVASVDAAMLDAVQSHTRGWPAAVRLAVEAIRRGEAVHEAAVDAPFATLAAETLGNEPPASLALLARVALLERFNSALCEAAGLVDAEETLTTLARRGLFLQPDPQREGWFTLHVLMREYAQLRAPLGGEERRSFLREAGDWLIGQGLLPDALAALEQSGDGDAVASFLIEHGSSLVAAGHGSAVARAARLVPPDGRGWKLETLLGWAARLRGDWDEAMERYRAAARDREILPAALAWRMVESLYARHRLEDAIAVAGRADLDAAGAHDQAMLWAWHASARYRIGEVDAGVELARRARQIAERINDAEALASAYTAEAMIGGVGVSEELMRRARRAAERAGDIPPLVRILTNIADTLREKGRFSEAANATDTALPLAEVTGDGFLVARVLSIRALAALAQGRLTEAVSGAEAARHSVNVALEAAETIGHARREAGELAASKVAYLDALRLAEESKVAGALEVVNAALARLLVFEDARAALGAAERALAVRGGDKREPALTSAGWVVLATGDQQRAAALAWEAIAMAERSDRTVALAEAFELGAMAATAPDVGMLERAHSIWQQIGNAVAAARVEVAIATVGGDDAARTAALRRLQSLGVRTSDAARAAGLLAALPPIEAPALEIRTLGVFAVIRSGVVVPVGEWKSRKARDLLKILVARRGRATPRETIMDALWPNEDPASLSNRLSVALAVLRSVLDPNRAHDSQYFVSGGQNAVRLHIDRVPIDVETLLASPAALPELPSPEHRHQLEAGVALYAGDFLEEDPYEDWAASLREEARQHAIDIARAIAHAALRQGDEAGAVRWTLKLLEWDPFDEDAHTTMVRALAASGRHGEARRRYRVYVATLEALGVAPCPYPG